ncbi:MAG TPA: carboxypeptidase regulatory-like domain-containing protein [Vicinamibacterales bacterium]|nr:carboxypeptidase regulatory-like domain-containing protein [Vicinamibacterales bacterium]
MKSRASLAAVLVCLLAWAVPAFAQEQTGSIQGVVKDASGAVLPGVTVEARSPSAVGVSTAITDAQGIYRFPALPPGTYRVTANLQGFAPATIDNAVLVLGKMLTIDISLKLQGVSETVQVTGESPLIDVKQNAAYATIQADTIARIPKGRDFESILAIAPGAQDESKSGGIQIDGASGSENRYVIDGMDTTNMQDGTSGKTMLLDFVKEVQVKSSGYNAEFGGATGGVVSVLTKSGSNDFHGQLGTYYSGSQFYGAKRSASRFNPFNAKITETGLVTPYDSYRYWSPLGDIGGPILRDRLWFYGSLDYTKNTYANDATFYTDPSKTRRHFDRWSDSKYANYNVTSQLSNSMRLKFSASNQRDGNRGTLPTLQPNNALALPASSIYPDGVPSVGMSTSTFDKNPDGSIDQTAFDNRWVNTGANSTTDVFSGNLDWVIRPTLFVNASAGSYRANDTTPAEFRGDAIRHSFSGSNSDAAMLAAGYPTVPVQFQQPNSYTDNISSSGTVRDLFTRYFFNANTTWYKRMAGQHTFKVGMRFERFANDVLDGFAKPNITLYWGQSYTNPETGQPVTGKYGYYIVNQRGTIGKVHSDNYAFWVQDGWDVTPRLTLNVGVRTENEYVPSYKDQKIYPDALSIKFGFKDKIAPRLGFAYDVLGDGKWKTYGSYGWFYDITKLELPRGSFGGDHWVDYAWTLDTPDFSTIQCGEGTSGCPGTYIGPPNGYDYRHSSNQVDSLFEQYFNRPGMTGIDPNLKPVKTGEFTAGVEHELMPTMSLGVRYVHKWMFRTIEDNGIYVQGVEDYLIANPGEGFATTMEPLYPDFPTPKPVRKYDGLEFRLEKRYSHNWTGSLSYLRSRLWGNYSGLASSDENGRTSPNVNRYYDNNIMSYGSSGKAVYGPLPTDRPNVFKANGAYDFPWGTTVGLNWFLESGTPQTTVVRFTGYPVFVYGRGDLGRSPALSQLDLNLTQEFKLIGHTKIQLGANIDNVFDQKTWLSYYNLSSYGPQKYASTSGGSGNIVLTMPPAVLYQQGGYNLDQIVGAYKGNLMPNPFYTTPNTFQSRREMRFEAKITF